jgi:hypothetical protein
MRVEVPFMKRLLFLLGFSLLGLGVLAPAGMGVVRRFAGSTGDAVSSAGVIERSQLTATPLDHSQSAIARLLAPGGESRGKSSFVHETGGSASRAGAVAGGGFGLPPEGRSTEKLPSEVSLNIQVSVDQVTGKTLKIPAQAGHQIAEAEVLNEAGEGAEEYDEAGDVPPVQATEWKKLRWLEAIMVDGISHHEAEALAIHMIYSRSVALTKAILSTASLAETSPHLRAILDHALRSTQPLEIRMQALHIANDHYPDLVSSLTTDAAEDLRLQAMALLDPGQQGGGFRE